MNDPLEYPLATHLLRDTQNKILTQSLFLETNQNTTYLPIFTLKEYDWERDGKFYPSLKKIYLQIAEPTEYEFAMSIFGSWRIWQRICNNGQVKKEVELWREELELKILSANLKGMAEVAKHEGSKGVTAMRYLAEGAWKKKAGRPKK